MLPYAIRKALFFLFVGIFLISAPLVVLYTAGYRFNRTTSTVSQTGTLSLASTPRGATSYVNGIDIQDATPAVLQRLSPGTRKVRLARAGYHEWERTVQVQSGSTAYVTAPLFLQQSAVLLTEGGSAWNRALAANTPEPVALPSDIAFTPTSSGIEVSLITRSDNNLLTLLPSDTYTPTLAEEGHLFVTNSKNELLYISLTHAQAAKTLGKDVVAFTWEPNEKLFAWTDGLEVQLFSPISLSQELITRLSDPVSALTFAHSGESLVLASTQGLLGIDLLSYVDGRMQTSLASFSEPTTAWFTEDGSVAYLETASGISSLGIAP